MNGLAQLQPSAVSIKAHTAYDLEVTLVKFIDKLFGASYRLDNPTLNLAQASVPTHPIQIVRDPDQPPVAFDYTQRAQTLALKVAPRVVRGRIPRTVTGEIDADKLSDVPSVIVQCVSAKVEIAETIATVRICATTYDENPDSQGYQDVLNMIEAMAIALTTFGSGALDQAYPIVMPIEWKLYEAECFPHFIGEMTTQWELPSGRPLPDFGECFIPAEHIHLGLSAVPVTFDGGEPDVELPPPEPEPPPPDALLAVLTPNKFSPSDDRITLDSHPFGADDVVKFTPVTADDILPTPIIAGVYYHVIDPRGNDFRISEQTGGSPVDITDKGTGSFNLWQKVT